MEGFLEGFQKVVDAINGVVWGPVTLFLIVGTGVFLTIRLGFLQIRDLPYALKLTFSRSKKKDDKAKGDISHFQSLMTAMAATLGIGNMTGVASAILLGGVGALFWMWLAAFFGMATKYGEAILAVKYRTVNHKGEISGGPMYYIEKGLGWKWLAILFALFGFLASFGIGNMTQSNTVAGSLQATFNINPWITGFVLMVLTALVLLGGIKGIGRVSAIFVPFMALFYMAGGLVIILLNITQVPEAFLTIFHAAINPEAVGGGAIGLAIRYGIARGVFSNEAGLGSAPIAAAAAKTDYPGRQALVSMTGTFLDTMIVCTITGLVIVMSGLHLGLGPESQAVLTGAAFESFLPGIGNYVVVFGIIFFAYSTIIGWSYYGEKCFGYIFGDQNTIYYKVIFCIMVMVGAGTSVGLVWDIADIFNGLMAIPNLIALCLLSGVIVAETNKFREVRAKEKLEEKRSKMAS
ncbi:transporter [Alkalihalobacillus alcalophilus ATCC 27647 = CGMCC 1.3604]|uniref:Transporter n=1 Tax=Alkalihalobacillus alcalophilus ATCC 27647 = CGMCC 1.3604 TaxID=1218173 RepID=J8QDK4_ALKAL|nr:sodium:alanine symporter family protein [Alkalihalobacillus alcalophilus]AFV25654.1 sodium ion:alanine symporter transporter [Alkalihalobacillus alcalophilus ATCC 27647 = CGMCC 1.3604]KGA98849.1 transporter [Alkalihalobacillus alcalophilus ATCC 27647 = CGMCC 1.3604]MED1564258.1 sodium:alanine symporter family protein [Alkalihalobacillus alcalophilus]THG90734.1 transporter [Alkalihalobacillus alcalophilus ATCC 27647 = CGMCC 1.3604]